MAELEINQQTRDRSTRLGYYFMLALLVLVVWLRLATPLLAALFTYLALMRLRIQRRGGKLLAVGIVLVVFAGVSYGLGHFVKHTIKSLPEIADKAIPSIIAWARQYNIELPFTDYDSLKDAAFDTVTGEVKYLSSFAKFARGASAQILFLAVGCVVAMSLFLKPRFMLGQAGKGTAQDLYSLAWVEIGKRFSIFYRSFVTVMGAQIIISGVNTFLTAIFVAVVHLPYAVVVLGATFLCGLLPIVGNLVSNTIIVGIGFTVSPKMALVALVFLVVIHKFEYFLNSEIVGWRTRNPLWLTLLGLLVGERLLGVPGMILAPVVLNYIRLEASSIKPGFIETGSAQRPAAPDSRELTAGQGTQAGRECK
ncbi:MAG TPA: AI-2E family transporter [Candidatus Acidoferrum sp.]|jgi:predicted PurR-regulated permease PerM|nr:AI-2E family transporter [Candidatus Acidoferrum sp.]